MIAQEPTWPGLRALLPRFLELKDSVLRTGPDEEVVARAFDELADEMEGYWRVFAETIVMCRQLAARFRGEDVPDSIYPRPDEDPADTARWKRWRMPESDSRPE